MKAPPTQVAKKVNKCTHTSIDNYGLGWHACILHTDWIVSLGRFVQGLFTGWKACCTGLIKTTAIKQEGCMQLTRHCEDSHHQADAPVGQKRDLHLSTLCAFLHFLCFHGRPDADSQHKQVEDDHHHQTWCIESHRGWWLQDDRHSASPAGCWRVFPWPVSKFLPV